MPKPDVHLRFLGRVGLERTSVNGQANARTKRTAALAVALLAVCLPAAWAIGPPRPQAPRAAPRYERQQARNNREQNRPQPRQGAPAQGRMQGNGQESGRGYGQSSGGQSSGAQGSSIDRQPGYGQNAQRPTYGGANGAGQDGSYARQQGADQGYGGQRQPYSGGQRPANGSSIATTPGHLQDWLNRHQNTPVQDQDAPRRSELQPPVPH